MRRVHRDDEGPPPRQRRRLEGGVGGEPAAAVVAPAVVVDTMELNDGDRSFQIELVVVDGAPFDLHAAWEALIQLDAWPLFRNIRALAYSRGFRRYDVPQVLTFVEAQLMAGPGRLFELSADCYSFVHTKPSDGSQWWYWRAAWEKMVDHDAFRICLLALHAHKGTTDQLKLIALGEALLSTSSRLERPVLEREQLHLLEEATRHWLCEYSSVSARDPLERVLRSWALRVELADFESRGIVAACLKRGRAHAARFENDEGLALTFLLFLRLFSRKNLVEKDDVEDILQLCVHAVNVHPMSFSLQDLFLDLLQDICLRVNASKVLTVAGAEIGRLVHWKSAGESEQRMSEINGRAFKIARHLLVDFSVSRERPPVNSSLPVAGEAKRRVE
jgi:hypothetical protein